MYTIKCDSYPLLDLRVEELILVNPKVKLEVNKVGESSFTIYKNHPYYGKMMRLKSIFEVSDEIGVIFRGRMTEHTREFDNGKAVDLEGLMAFFNDTVVAPYVFPDDFLENPEYIAASNNGNVVEFFLKWLIDNHNSQVPEWQRFKLGNVTVSDPNNYLSRSESGMPSTWETLKSKLFDSALGGNLCIRYENDGNYIDYLSEFTLTNTQRIRFGENLLTLKHKEDATTTYSAMIPIGAEVETTVENEDGTSSTEKNKVTLENIPDGAVTDDIWKMTLSNGLHAIFSIKAVETYGWICAPVSETTWQDVTEENNLLTKSKNLLITEGMMLSDTVEITAADLHFSDDEIRAFRIYRKISVESEPHDINEQYDLTKLDIDILKPQNTKITVGKTKLTMTDQSGKDQAENAEKIKEMIKDLEESRNETTELKNTVVLQRTELINTCNEIIFGALTEYTETGDFEEYKRTVESQLQILSESITMQFTETMKEIENVNGDLQEKFNTITKYFAFDINGLTIGQSDNPFKVIIDNDRFSMLVNGVEVLWLDPEGKSNIPELNITRELNLFGYLINKDQNGNVNCEYVGEGLEDIIIDHPEIDIW